MFLQRNEVSDNVVLKILVKIYCHREKLMAESFDCYCGCCSSAFTSTIECHKFELSQGGSYSIILSGQTLASLHPTQQAWSGKVTSSLDSILATLLYVCLLYTSRCV